MVISMIRSIPGFGSHYCDTKNVRYVIYAIEYFESGFPWVPGPWSPGPHGPTLTAKSNSLKV